MQNHNTTASSPLGNQDSPRAIRSKLLDGWEAEYHDIVDTIPLQSDSDLLSRGIQCNGVNPDQVIMQFGSWVVTDFGMECLSHYYPIKKEALDSCYWVAHFITKRWVNKTDFLHCIEGARWYYHRRKSTPVIEEPISSIGWRFDILKRDGYRCQICGRTARDGVRLEVDHKVPKAKGGATTDENLWTLCWPCNHGKRDKDL